MMRDEELKKALDKWEAPHPGRALDQRVWGSYRRAQPKPLAWKLWGAVAAGVLLVVGTHLFSAARPKVAGDPTHLETRLTTAGFRPIPDGAVTVVKVKAKQ